MADTETNSINVHALVVVSACSSGLSAHCCRTHAIAAATSGCAALAAAECSSSQRGLDSRLPRPSTTAGNCTVEGFKRHHLSPPPCAQAHIWLLLAGWGFLIPVGIVIGRCLKHLDPLWFQLHRWGACMRRWAPEPAVA